MRILIFFFLLQLSACSIKIECKGLSLQQMQQAPYNKCDTLLFVSNNNTDTLKIFLTNVELSKPYVRTCKDLHGICNCEQWLKVFARCENKDFLFMEMKTFSEVAVYNFLFYVFDYSFEIDFEDFEKNHQYIPNVEFYQNMVIAGQSYTKVFAISNPNYQTSQVKKVLINKTEGILQIEQTNQITWTKIKKPLP